MSKVPIYNIIKKLDKVIDEPWDIGQRIDLYVNLPTINKLPVVKEQISISKKGHTLCDEWDNRDLKTEVEGNFKWIEDLPSDLSRQLAEDADVRTIFNDEGKVVKIIRKRDSSSGDPQEFYYVFDEEGKKIKVSREEIEKINNTTVLSDLEEEEREQLQEDLDEEISLESIESSYLPVRDKWDVIFDISQLEKAKKRILSSKEYQSIQDKDKQVTYYLREIEKAIFISKNYSFPENRLVKRNHIKNMIKLINQDKVSAQQLRRFCKGVTDKRKNRIRELSKRRAKTEDKLEKERLTQIINSIQDSLRKTGKPDKSSIALSRKKKDLSVTQNEIANLYRQKAKSISIAEDELTELIEHSNQLQKEIEQLERKLKKEALHPTKKIHDVTPEEASALWHAWRLRQGVGKESIPYPKQRYVKMVYVKCFTQLIAEGLLDPSEANFLANKLGNEVYSKKFKETIIVK